MSEIKKIVLFGPESTGKTTLSLELAKHFRTIASPEFARHYVDIKKAHTKAENLDEIIEWKDVETIAIGQIHQENLLEQHANQVLFCDTNLVTTHVYSQLYFGKSLEWMDSAVEKQAYDFYLLLTVDVPWVADFQRDSSLNRIELFNTFKSELDQREINYKTISGASYKDRLQQVIEIVEDFLSSKQPSEDGCK
ncbi:MAG: HTH-type transcriptional repressor of NAD biosynthesis genes [Arenicella sp.]|jgi:HTH-type transcriptional repressor of NAD biosynthesis genes